MNFLLIFFVSVSLFLTGCDRRDDVQKVNEKIESLQQQIEQLTKKQQDDIETVRNVIIYMANNENEADFTPASQGYTVLKTNVGYFLVSLENITKYADGYKAVFSIGNPNYVTYKGLKFSVQWGTAYDPANSYLDWRQTLKLKEVEVNDSFLPGVWTKVTFVLSPATAKETGFIGFSVQANEVRLMPDFRRVN